MKIQFRSQRREMHRGRRDVTCKPAMINWEKRVDAARTLLRALRRWKLVSINFDQIQVKHIVLKDSEGQQKTKKAKIEVRKQTKSLRAIRRTGYVCHTSSANAMNSFSLSLLPSKHCLFWCLLSASTCLLVLTRYFDEKLRNKESCGSKQSRGDA